MEDLLISVIVPVYKTEKYLRQCVDSIRSQTYMNLEIILVDDGSPDSCGQICDEFAQVDRRIRVIHKENGGMSSARNAGLDIAEGELVAFVDSDDQIASNMYEYLYDLMEKNDAQIAACGLQTDTGIHFNRDYSRESAIETFSRMEALIEVTKNHKVTNSVCDKLWKKVIFDNIRFPEGAYFEDLRILHKCLELVERVVYSPEPLYIYRMTEESVCRGAFHPRMLQNVNATKERAIYYLSKFPEISDYAEADYIRVNLMQIWRFRKARTCRVQHKSMIKEMKGKLPSGAVRILDRKNKVKLYALRIGTPFFYFLMTLSEIVDKIKGK